MAITLSTPTTGVGSSLGSDLYGFLHEVTAGTKILVMGVTAIYNGGDGLTNGNWNGTAMLVAARINSSAFCAAIFYLTNPEVGTYNIAAKNDSAPGVPATASPRLFAVNLSGNLGSASPIGDTHTGSEDQTFTVQGTEGVIFDAFLGDTVATVDAASTIIWDDTTIGVADKCAASYRTHAGSNFSVDHTADLDFYAGAEFKNSNDLVPLQVISL